MPTNRLFLDRTNKRLLSSVEYPEPVSFDALIPTADGAQIPIQIIGVNQAEDGRYEPNPYGDLDLLLTVANPKERPESGTFVIAHDVNESEELHLENLTADALDRALNSIPSINALGGVQVTLGSDSDDYLIQALQDGDWTATPLSIARESMAPHGLAILTAISEGAADGKATWLLRFAADPYGYIDNWTVITGATITNEIATSGAGSNYQTERLEISGPVKGGLFTVTEGALQTAPIQWDASATDVQSAINALSDDLNVTVEKESSRTWLVTRGEPGYFAPFGTRNSLVSWQGVEGTLPLNTTQLAASMAGNAKIPAQLQIVEKIDTTNRKPVYLEKLSIHADLISGVDLIEIPIPNDYLTDAPSDGKLYGRQDGQWTEVIIEGGPALIKLQDAVFTTTPGVPVTADVDVWLSTNSQVDGTMLLYVKPVSQTTGRFENHGEYGTAHTPDDNGPIYAWIVYNDQAHDIGLVPGSDPNWQFTNWSATEIRLGDPTLLADWADTINAAIESLPGGLNAIKPSGSAPVYTGSIIFRSAEEVGNFSSGSSKVYVISKEIRYYKFMTLRGESPGQTAVIRAAATWNGANTVDGEPYMMQVPFLLSGGGAMWGVKILDLILYCVESFQTVTNPQVNGIYFDASITSSMENVKVRSPKTNGVTVSGDSDTLILKQVCVEGRGDGGSGDVFRVPVCFNLQTQSETITMINCESQIADVGIFAEGSGPLEIINHESEGVLVPYDLRNADCAEIQGNVQTYRLERGPIAETYTPVAFTATVGNPGNIEATAHGLSTDEMVYFPTGTFTVDDVGGLGVKNVVPKYGFFVNVVDDDNIYISAVKGGTPLEITAGGAGTMGKAFSAVAKVVMAPDTGGPPYNYTRRIVRIKGNRDIDAKGNADNGVVVCSTSASSPPFVASSEQMKDFGTPGRTFDFNVWSQPQSNLPLFGVNDGRFAGDFYKITESEFTGVAHIIDLPDVSPNGRLNIELDFASPITIYQIRGGQMGQEICISIANGSSEITFDGTIGGARIVLPEVRTLTSVYDSLVMRRVFKTTVAIWTEAAFVGAQSTTGVLRGASLGVGIDPDLTSHIHGTNGPPSSSGTATNGIQRISQTSGTVALDMGVDAGGVGAWLQSYLSTAAENQFPLAINPLGGNVTIGAGGVYLPSLPTSDPVAAGQLWNDAGTVKVSSG